MSTVAHIWMFVAGSGPGSIWNVDGYAVYVRWDRNLRYPTWEGQVFLADDGVYVVEGGRWVKEAAA